MEHIFYKMSRLKQIINNLPSLPGVYQFFDKSGKIIYIGKAKRLKPRVSSYFNKDKFSSVKTKRLSEQVEDIKYILVENEADALLLENNLIKKYQPKYNVLLKDNKTFPWICIKNEPFPRVFSTRNLIKDGSEYFGPYTSGLMVKTILGLIRQLYQLRNCNYNLTNENIQKKKYKKCLEYHIGNCKAPCENLQSIDEYDNSIYQIKNILKGNINEVILHLKKLMNNFSDQYKYEDADKIKQKILLLERYKSKSTIVNPKLNNIDVFSIYENDNIFWVNFIKVINGAIVQSHTVEIKRNLEEKIEEVLLFAIIDIREKVKSVSKEIIIPYKISSKIKGVKFICPKEGDKKKLLDLSLRNAKQSFILKQQALESVSSENHALKVLEIVKKDLQLKEAPIHIECFDNSNIQGSNPVASCVVFVNGKPEKSAYRHYNIKTVKGANDFASMEEIVYRRYRRLLYEKAPLPGLVIIDGGKGQLNAAVKSLKKLRLFSSIPIIGIAKRLEEIYYPNDSVPVYLDKKSPTLKLIQKIRNEAHRFGISYHRSKRSSAMLKSQLGEIKGIGPVTIEKLLKHFKSAENIQRANIEEISKIVGNKIAKIVFNEIILEKTH